MEGVKSQELSRIVHFPSQWYLVCSVLLDKENGYMLSEVMILCICKSRYGHANPTSTYWLSEYYPL